MFFHKTHKLASLCIVGCILISMSSCGSNPSQSINSYDMENFQVTVNDPNERFYEAVSLEPNHDLESEPRTLLSGVLSDTKAFLISCSDSCGLFIEQYSLDGSLDSVSSFEIDVNTQFGNCRCFYVQNSIYICSCSLNTFDLYIVNIEEETISGQMHIDESDDDLSSFIKVAGIYQNTIYVKKLTEEGYKLKGYETPSGKSVFETQAVLGDIVDFVWMHDALCAINRSSGKQSWIVFDDKGNIEREIDEEPAFLTEEAVFDTRHQFISDRNGIWYVDDRDTITNILCWENTARDSTAFLSTTYYSVSDSLEYVLIYSDKGVAQLLIPGNKDWDDRKVLKLACLGEYQNEKLLWAVQEFNNSQDDYSIELVDYQLLIDESKYLNSEGYIDRLALDEAAMDMLWKDVVSGNGPDMIFRGVENYGKIHSSYLEVGGYIQDMSSYWYSESEAWRNQFLSPAFLRLEITGNLMAVPTICGLEMTVVDKDCSLETGAEISAFETYLNEHPDIPFFVWETKESFLETMLSIDLDSYINTDENKAMFDSADFRSLLELCNNYCMSNSVYEDDHDYSTLLLQEKYVSDGSEILECMFREFSEQRANPSKKILGYPTVSGADAYVLISDAISVTQTCQDISGAWSFIKFMLSHDVQSYAVDHGDLPNYMPVRWDSLNEILDYYGDVDAHKEYWTEESGDFDGWLYSYSDEELQSARDFISSVHHIRYPDVEIINIVLEESIAYFSGQKNIDDVISNINNRVQIVLDERYE